jgi:hypothetical protein
MVVGGNLNSPLNLFISFAKALMEQGFSSDPFLAKDTSMSRSQITRNRSVPLAKCSRYQSRSRRAQKQLPKESLPLKQGMAFLSLGSMGKPVDWSDPIPAYSDFQRRFWAHKVDLADNHSKTVYGRGSLGTFRHNLRQPRLDEALRIVANRHAAS